MIDIGCFDTVAFGSIAGEFNRPVQTGWIASPYPEIAEDQALSLGIEEVKVGTTPARSPYPRVVEEQFDLGIK